VYPNIRVRKITNPTVTTIENKQLINKLPQPTPSPRADKSHAQYADSIKHEILHFNVR
jgi:hypothetical protein